LPLKSHYDLIVVGAGHAGCEAAHAAARMGHDVLLLTLDTQHVALMSCNPSIGGLAKGHLVREIDALGGVQAIATDATGIQFRVLNRRKGPAVQAPRAQCDKLGYNAWMRDFIAATPGITLADGMAVDLITEPGGPDNQSTGHPRIAGVLVAPRTAASDASLPGNAGVSPAPTPIRARAVALRARAVVCTTGTFLDGKIHIGLRNFPAGRLGEAAAVGLGDAFKRHGFETGRLKTGTPPRLRRDSIDFSRFEIQPGDVPIPPFSFTTPAIEREQVCCWIGHTNERTHEVIRGGLDRSPLYTGVIEGIGPRYCPSIEDKVVRFAEKTQHQIFLEPEGLTTDWIYPNGLPTSLPEDVQDAMLRTIPGLEKVEIIRPGYAVEYTYCPPHQLHPSLMTRRIDGLFFGGQINGTSGYEEAAAQGLVAGINAALWLKGEPPLVLGRDEAYIGVLIDDLITMEHREPYRMFTSRAEYRLLLRHDTAELRLTPHGRRVGLVDDARWNAFEAYRDEVDALTVTIARARLRPDAIDRERFAAAGLPIPDESVPLTQYLSRPEVTLEALQSAGLLENAECGARNAEWNPKSEIRNPKQIQNSNAPNESENSIPHSAFHIPHWNRAFGEALLQIKYAGYIRKQHEHVEKMRRMGDKPLPDWIDYAHVHGLRNEARDKLARFRPATVGQAGRIAGINQTDLTLVLVYLKSRQAA
jgi:tRNA uridine 5-carboxymethylaminomethyl modification enzyme